MSDPYIGEVRQTAFNFVPPGWQACDGSLLQISQFDTLFTLLGTTYGGDGVQTFGVPDLRGRVAVHAGSQGGVSYNLGQKMGNAEVTLTVAQMPPHTHPVNVSMNNATVPQPAATLTFAPVTGADGTLIPAFAPAPGTNQLSPASLSPVGGSEPVSVVQPSLVTTFMIATAGMYPSPA